MILRNQIQIAAYQSPYRFNYILAGRRGGKTYLMTKKILKRAYAAPNYGEIFYIGPTNKDAKALIWENLELALRQAGWRYTPRIADRCFRLSRGRKIYIIGAEKIRGIRGHKVWHAFLDEVAYFSTPLSEVWRAVRPALSDLKGGADLATTPDGKGSDAYDFYLDILDKHNWKYWHWKTRDNPYIDPQEIEDAKLELDEKSFIQEYEAEWQSFEGLAYYNFNENTHIVKQPEINPSIPLHLAFDFNVNPTTLLLSQMDGAMLRYKREYSFKNSSTEKTVEAFCEDYKDKASYLQIKIRGDSAGKSRASTTGRSDYQYAQEILDSYGFKWSFEVRPANPPIVDRVKRVNGWLKPFNGLHKVEIDPTCKDLIRDLSSQELNGRAPSDKNNLGHKADAFGYDIYWQFNLTQQTKAYSGEI